MNHLTVRTMLISLAVTSLFAMVACGTEEAPGSGEGDALPVDAEKLTAEEIIIRAKVAMSGVTSYRTIGEITLTSEEEPDLQTGDFFTEWTAPDRYKYRVEGYTDGVYEIHELIRVDGTLFWAEGDGEWHHMSPSTSDEAETEIGSERGAGDPVGMLDADNIELIGEEEFAGVPVFRLSGELIGEADSDTNSLVSQMTRTLLIDRTNYQLVSMITDQNVQSTVSNTNNGVESIEYEWAHYLITQDFYDYNEPITIEAPVDSVNMFELESADAPARSFPGPPHTPTAVTSQNCSDPGASWPGCGIRTSADVEVMLAVFPDDAKISVDDDIVVTFPFESSLQIGWNADVYIWHVPSASVVRLCNEQTSQSWKSNSPEATDRFQQVLADDDLMESISARPKAVDGQC